MALRPPPVDLRVHIPMHTDAETFLFVSQGVPGTAMPAWEGLLTEAERWDVVNYLLATYGSGTQAAP